jgi:hypothetical protein
MKIEIKEPKFSPITITLERVEEAAILAWLIGHTTPGERKRGVDTYYGMYASKVDEEPFTALYGKLNSQVLRHKDESKS